MFEKMIDVPTSSGLMNSYLYAPDEGGPFPVVLFFMDSAGVREPLSDMCRRLASAGYFVAMPNLYYRRTRYLDIDVNRFEDPAYADRLELMWSLNHHLENRMVMSDAAALLDALSSEPSARPGKIGILGYCMSGEFAFRAAAEFDDRVGASIAMYGGPYSNERPDSAHASAARVKGFMYFGVAEHDVHFPTPIAIANVKSCLSNTSVQHRVELYDGREHGFALPGRRVYHKASSERHWVRIFNLFGRFVAGI